MVTYFKQHNSPLSTNEGVFLTGIYLQELSWKDNRVVDRPTNTFDGVLLPILCLKVEIKTDEPRSSNTISLPLYREEGWLGADNELMHINLESDVDARKILMTRARLSCF